MTGRIGGHSRWDGTPHAAKTATGAASVGDNRSVTDRQKRKDMLDAFKRSRPEAGVYRIVNRENGRMLLDSSVNLAGTRNRFEFTVSTDTPLGLAAPLREEAREFGLGVFEFEVLDVLDVTPEMSAGEIEADLATLEQLWRERLDAALLL